MELYSRVFVASQEDVDVIESKLDVEWCDVPNCSSICFLLLPYLSVSGGQHFANFSLVLLFHCVHFGSPLRQEDLVHCDYCMYRLLSTFVVM